jgi:hypothetical protein
MCDTRLNDRCHTTGQCACGPSGGSCTAGQKCQGGQCKCDPATCAGCCDSNGVTCQPGTAKNACGADGGVCVKCPPKACVAYVCQ